MLRHIETIPQTFTVSPYVESIFNGRKLITYFHGQEIDSRDAKLGEVFYVTAQGQKKPPVISFPKMPESRGEKIAWVLSFIGDEKYMKTEAEFYSTYQELIQSNSITNTAVFTKYGRFAVALADKHLPEKNKVKANNPVLAWISDDITREELNSLLDRYEVRKKLPCSRDFFYHL